MTKEIGDRVRERLAGHSSGSLAKDLASAVGMPADALSRALNGKREFSALELARIAEHLHTSTHWLITGDTDPRGVSVAARHAFNFDRWTHEAPAWADVQQQLSDVALAYQQVLDEYERTSIAQRGLTAEEVRERLTRAQGTTFVDNFAESVESALGVDVVRVDSIDTAYSIQVGSQPVIVVRETGNWFYQNWSIAHELAHVMAGTLQPFEQPRTIAHEEEARANAFAADLLLPFSELTRVDWQLVTPSGVADFIWNAGVSTNALRVRLTDLGIAVSSRVLSWLSLTTQKLLRQHWVGSNVSADEITLRMERASARRFPAKLISAHYAAVGAGRLHALTLAWMLGVPVVELDTELSPGEDNASEDPTGIPEWLDAEFRGESMS